MWRFPSTTTDPRTAMVQVTCWDEGLGEPGNLWRFSGLASLCWVLSGCLICLTMFIHESQARVSGLCLSQHASPDVEKMILGNKCDANDKRQVSREQGEKVSAVALMYFDLGVDTLPWYHSAVPEWNDWTFPKLSWQCFSPPGSKAEPVKGSCQSSNRCKATSGIFLKGC